jgi:hypothetical protein
VQTSCHGKWMRRCKTAPESVRSAVPPRPDLCDSCGGFMPWSTRGNCPNCGSGKFVRSRRVCFRERLVGILVLPYRCDRCGCRFFKWNRGPKRRNPVVPEPDPLWMRGRFGFPVALAVLAASVAFVAVRVGEQPRPSHPQTADRAGVVAIHSDLPVPPPAPAAPEAVDADRVAQTAETLTASSRQSPKSSRSVKRLRRRRTRRAFTPRDAF